MLDALQVSPNLMLCGDFNAHVGVLSGVNVRRCVRPLANVNKAGRLLVDLAAATSMAITTRRVPGDYGQPSHVGYYKGRSSWPDHILLLLASYKSVKAFEMLDIFASDHCGLSLVFQVGGCAGSTGTETERKG
eukprot:scaffold61706_cov34-Tisochrysis_lutea.AAC.1